MNEAERRALSTLTFNLVPVPDDVWRAPANHVPELHKPVVDSIFEGVSMARYEPGGTPRGVIVQGPAGSGKTHMLGMVRERTQRDETGYFFLVGLYSGDDFWRTVALALGQGLRRPGFGWPSQLVTFLRRMTTELGMATADRDAICGQAPLTREVLDRFVRALRTHDSNLGREVQHTARALVLMASSDFAAQDVADGYLGSLDGTDWADWADWGLPPAGRPARSIVEDMSRLLARTGPTVIAFDQLDMLFAKAIGQWKAAPEGLPADQRLMLAQIAEGLVALRQLMPRTLIIVSCIPATWQLLATETATPFSDRFRESAAIGRIADAGVARDVVRKHLHAHWAKAGFTPPSDDWPMAPHALDAAGQYTARTLLRLVDKQVRRCVRDGVAPGKATLKEIERWPEDSAVPTPTDDPGLDKRFDALVTGADAEVAAALDPRTEDESMPLLLEAGLRAWMLEQPRAVYKVDPPPGKAPALHARLREVLDEDTEDERHWAIRGIASSHHGAVRSRIGKACLAAGLTAGVRARRVALLRNATWDLGVKTLQYVEQFRDSGGLTLTVDEYDLKVFAALRQLLDEKPAGLTEWLVASRPAGNTRLFREVIEGTTGPEIAMPEPAPDPTPEPAPPPVPGQRTDDRAPDVTSFPLGTLSEDGGELSIPLASLRKHTVIFAGSGSGKTVLIRRLVEECALAGVSAIVLDPNNDLARLGDAWPTPPDGWGSGDAEKAQRYLAGTEVMVWTPMISRGNPVTFQPLPNFAAVLHDPDELRAAVDIAVAALAPRARMDATTVRAVRGQAVLRSALYHFARHGVRPDLDAFISVLADLPEGVTDLLTGPKLAREMAETLIAVRTNDPLFGGDGIPVDPARLLTPSEGMRARISVVSFVGLNSDEQRQAFVNQLQMALFAWIKRNPAGDRPLGGLFVMDEAQDFAPSTGNTPCTESTLQLASQARKYGLGLVFATQAPKGLHNRISGNATTQFFGLLNAQVQVTAARDLAQAKGSTVPDISLLGPGEFYTAGEGTGFRKVRTPLCLSHHPSSPLPPEEVVELARRSAARLSEAVA